MQNVYIEKNKCCGCTACENICPKSAISMQYDDYGYKYPVINQEVCIDCGQCQATCQFANPEIKDRYDVVKCYAIKHKNINVIKQSRSAGAFTLLSNYILDNGGVVYGAAFNKVFHVAHIRATTRTERDLLRKSKYVQSDLKDVFASVLNDLKNDFTVMFTGTGCQCDGLRAFLLQKKCDVSKLILVDIICHGVPSPIMFEEYIKWNEKRAKSKLTDFEFRDKNKFSWGEGVERLSFENGKVIFQDYFTGYIFDYLIRPSCYNCKYTTPYRNSDITLGDFWGSENSTPEFTDRKNGCSLMLLHSERAQFIFNEIKKDSFYKRIDIKDCLQPRLCRPREFNQFSEKLCENYKTKGFGYIMKKFAKNSYSKSNLFCKKTIRIIKLPMGIVRRLMK